MNDKLQDTDNSIYKVGQLWSYKTRPSEPDSEFIVIKVETHPDWGIIVHISLRGLKVKNHYNESGFSSIIVHLPFEEASIIESVTEKLADNAPLPDFQDGYSTWQEAFDQGKGGVWQWPIAKAIDAMEDIINSPK